MHRVKPKYEVLVPAELADLADIYEPCYKKAKILVPVAQELQDLTDIYCEHRTPAPVRRVCSNRSTQQVFRIKEQVEVQGRRLSYKQPKLTSMFQQTKTRSRKKLYGQDAV
jgi:hypothetical protein